MKRRLRPAARPASFGERLALSLVADRERQLGMLMEALTEVVEAVEQAADRIAAATDLGGDE